MDMIDRTCCRSAFCSRSHCSGKFENFKRYMEELFSSTDDECEGDKDNEK